MRIQFLCTFAISSAMLIGVASTVQTSGFVVPPRTDLSSSPYAEWAHHHWVWLNHGDQNQSKMADLVHEYQARNITVGAINIDSTWSTGFNNFVVDKSKFPDLGKLVSDMHNMDIRVILWVTSMINSDSSNFEEGLAKGYFIKNAFGTSTPIKWWHGKGCLLDYSNPEALKWWHD